MFGRWMRRILQISILFVFYYIGEAIQQFFSLLIPGSIIGMLLFFLLLSTHIIPLHWVNEALTLF
ncbi:murein hydrolase exporter [Gracilibacillus halophilus YIM-C55.5]|uniref:Murein hydrolase exporter n=1 Tax=Gracilibacillus halophilus YIM-C55.5 TaxID=1308866 RepID=N4W6C4_9BACI|nr:murein hydrolase exporter [Gracilibacillus halophilus YIM-C55.5]